MPHRLMKLPLDPSHLEMPFNVVVAVVGSTASLAVAAWQFIGSMLSQFPTPDKVSGWQERDVYLCACIVLAGTLGYVVRFGFVHVISVLRENSKSTSAVADALTAFTAKVDGIVTPAVTHAMDQTFSKPDTPHVLATSKKRYDPPGT